MPAGSIIAGQSSRLSEDNTGRSESNGPSLRSVSSGACTPAAVQSLSQPRSTHTGKQFSLADQSLAAARLRCPISVWLHMGDLAHATKTTKLIFLFCQEHALCANKRSSINKALLATVSFLFWDRDVARGYKTENYTQFCV